MFLSLRYGRLGSPPPVLGEIAAHYCENDRDSALFLVNGGEIVSVELNGNPENHKTSEDEKQKTVVYGRQNMFGRRMILTSEQSITAANVAKVIDDAYNTHCQNRGDIDYLWNYYKGKQPSLYRQRDLRPEISKNVVENRANQIVDFKTGYLLGKPITYVSSTGNKDTDDVSASIGLLNNAMRKIGKRTKDKELVEWCMIAGVGFRYVVQNKDRRKKAPFNIHTLDPRDTFVIRANDYSKRVLAGVNYVTDKSENITFTIYTEDSVFTLKKGTGKPTVQRNQFGMIPIIEYPANSARLGAFEIVLSMLDAINDFDCMRLEAVENFVQSLLVLYNCQIEEGTTADKIRAAGMILLKSLGDNKADVKNLSEQLDQRQNQTLKDDMWQTVLQIVGMPSQGDGNTGDSSNNGAVVLKNGWQGAETRAQAFEDMFQLPEMEMLDVVSVICEGMKDGFVFDPSNIDIKFPRHNYDNLLSKSQTLVTMLGSDKIHPKCAYEASGLFSDTEEAYQLAMEWYNKIQAAMAKENTPQQPKEAPKSAVTENE